MNSANPVTWGSAILGLVTAGIGLVTAFGVNLSDQQSGAILTFIGALIVTSGFVLHNQVTPKSVAQDKINEAWQAPPDASDALKPKA